MPDTPSKEDIFVAINRRLRPLFDQLSRETEQWPVHCRGCGRCCDFSRGGGVILFASSVEVLWVLGRAVPIQPEAGRCPFQHAGRCRVRPWRPLGCRVYYCALGENSSYYGIYQQYLRRLKEIASELGIAWEYGPFLKMLPRYADELEEQADQRRT